jgi:hypothetical protein
LAKPSEFVPVAIPSQQQPWRCTAICRRRQWASSWSKAQETQSPRLRLRMVYGVMLPCNRKALNSLVERNRGFNLWWCNITWLYIWRRLPGEPHVLPSLCSSQFPNSILQSYPYYLLLCSQLVSNEIDHFGFTPQVIR